jgi:hypothetical protein
MRRWAIVFSTFVACGEGPRDEDVPATSGPTGGGDPATSGSSGAQPPGDGTDAMKLDAASVAPDLGGTGPVGCDQLDELPTNQGCEFWAVDLPNVSMVPPLTIDTVPADQQFAVVVTNPAADTTANVEIFVADDPMPVASGAVPFDTMRVFELPALNITPGATTADGQAYRVVSDVPITAYQFQPLDNTSPVHSNDATLLFPTHVLDGDYTAITGDANLVALDGFSLSNVNTGAFVSVVGTEDDTTVTLFPTAALHPGAVENVTIGRGQVLTAISSETGAPTYGNLSGTRVVADKPVAVFSGSVATSEPADTTACCADHLEHQMLPLAAWGTRYVAAPAASATGSGNDASLWRITGAFDGTELDWDPAPPPGAPTSIDAYESVAFVGELPFVVTATDETKPFAVTQFLLSNQWFGGGSRPGDPSMILLPAAEQLQDRYVFLAPQGYASSVVTVVAPEGIDLELDGTAVAGGSFAPLGLLDGTGYTYAHLPIEPGSHRIEGTGAFGIVVSGHSPDVSYGYAGGSGVAIIHEPPPPPAG